MCPDALLMWVWVRGGSSVCRDAGHTADRNHVGPRGPHRLRQGPQVLANGPLLERWLLTKAAGTVH